MAGINIPFINSQTGTNLSGLFFGRSGFVGVATANEIITAAGLAPIATSGSATDLTSGTVNDARLSANIPRLSAMNTFLEDNTFLKGIAARSAFQEGIEINLGVSGRGKVRFIEATGFSAGHIGMSATGIDISPETASGYRLNVNSALNVTGAATFGGQVTVNNDLVMTANTLLARQVRVSGAAGVQYSTTTPATGASGNTSFMHYTANLADRLYLYDLINGRNQVTYLRGTTDALALAQFHSRVTVDNNLTVGDGTAYGVALKGNITGSRITLNPSGMKAMYSYADVTYAGWVNNSLSTGEYYYFGGGGHYFGHNGSNLLTLTGSGATFSGKITATANYHDFAGLLVAPAGQANVIAGTPGRLQVAGPNSELRIYDRDAAASSENFVVYANADILRINRLSVDRFTLDANGNGLFGGTVQIGGASGPLLKNGSGVVQFRNSADTLPASINIAGAFIRNNEFISFADSTNAFSNIGITRTVSGVLRITGPSTAIELDGGNVNIGNFLQIGSTHKFRTNNSKIELRNSANDNYAPLVAGDLWAGSTSFGSAGSPANARVVFGTASTTNVAAVISGRAYASNFSYGDLILSANPNIGVLDYSNLTDDLVIRGNTGHVEINRGRLILNDTVNPSSWALKTAYNTEVGQLQFINNSSVAQMILTQSGLLTAKRFTSGNGSLIGESGVDNILRGNNTFIKSSGGTDVVTFTGTGNITAAGKLALNGFTTSTFTDAAFQMSGTAVIQGNNSPANIPVLRIFNSGIQTNVTGVEVSVNATGTAGIGIINNGTGNTLFDMYATASGGDIFTRYRVLGDSVIWNVGLDRTDNTYKVSTGGTALGTNDRLWIATTGKVTLSHELQLGGNSGPLLKNSSGTVQFRNSADSAFGSLIAGTVNVDSASDSQKGIRLTNSGASSGHVGLMMIGHPGWYDNNLLLIHQNAVVANMSSTFFIVRTNAQMLGALSVTGGATLSSTLAVTGDIEAAADVRINTSNDLKFNRAGQVTASTGRIRWWTSGLFGNSIGPDSTDFTIVNQSLTAIRIKSAGNVDFQSYLTSAFQTMAANPTTSDISAGNVRVVKNTTSGEVRLWCNDGGTMKSILFA